ncbi:hypothetical protein FRC08_011827, partial [Ceratobasidium sp. 394]
MPSLHYTLFNLGITLVGVAYNITNAFLNVVYGITALVKVLLDSALVVIKALSQALYNLITSLGAFLIANLPIMIVILVFVLMYQHFRGHRRK